MSLNPDYHWSSNLDHHKKVPLVHFNKVNISTVVTKKHIYLKASMYTYKLKSFDIFAL